ncbi:nitroreductase family protein [Brenneria goodwinii]|uniref:nitroreductase family protein n=1 Tax=Brenneria goodwinii TaxID=1109412 RepID=UPI000EF1930E|nr:nitroreductase family protein [Brenneria goodwinii]MCG8154923.1 nitroreductase family protein [Brenneria goodwinii]MCG8162766.1 nitroreductase family protein [Brenneria goodwinii]MCG8164161.1 nitroreductase family protein [Brenneria goodwinii]MCG8168770.1 nitroreductase family protein [Brenneria goodwinii]MCG8173675.1 nitroreductase family protein [Brenneria goodwinii]
MSNAFLQSIKNRRSIYAIGKTLPISEDRVISLVTEAVKQSPSSFNSQSSRVVILFGEQHEKLWDIVKQQLKKIVPEEAFAPTEKKLASFAAGAGTVLFFEDTKVIEDLQQKFALYADNFPVWSEHSTGIAQFSVWSALAQEKVGASLQHYNPLIDDDVKKQWQLPASWKLRAQMPFGSIEQPAGEKTYIPDEERFRIFK